MACTKTERNEPVGYTITFSVPQADDAGRQDLESLFAGLQTIVLPDRQKRGYPSYTCFIPAQNSQSADAIVKQLKGVKGIASLSKMPVNAHVRESLLSQLGSKMFSTHVDATAMRDDELQNTVNRQLKEKGFHNISVTVTRNENDVRTLQLHPAEDAPNYSVNLSIDDKGTKMVLQEEKISNSNGPAMSDKPQVDFGSMTDAQVRDYIRREYGKGLRDENIKITRTAEEIAIDIKLSDNKEELMRFRLQ